MFCGGGEEVGIELGDVGDRLAVWGPGGGAVCTRIGGDLGEMRALVGIVHGDDPDVCVIGGIGVGRRAIASECQEFAVGGPGGLGVVVFAGSDLSEGLGRDVEHVEMGTATIEVTHFVEFELQTIDDPGFLRFLFVLGVAFSGVSGDFVFAFLGGFEFLGTGVTKNQNEPAAVGGPGEVFHVLRGVCKALGFAAEAVEQPDLGLAFIAGGEESDELAIGAPAGVSGGRALGG